MWLSIEKSAKTFGFYTLWFRCGGEGWIKEYEIKQYNKWAGWKEWKWIRGKEWEEWVKAKYFGW